MSKRRHHRMADGPHSGQASGGVSLPPEGILSSSDEVLETNQPEHSNQPIAAPAAPKPTLISDYQVCNRWSFNFTTSKTSLRIKAINLPAQELATEMAQSEPDRNRVAALRADLLVHAEREFQRWEERLAQ